MDFVESCILKPEVDCEPIKRAFHESYTGKKGGNRFTKTRIDLEADQALRRYFVANNKRSDTWFNVITPNGQNLDLLATQLRALLG